MEDDGDVFAAAFRSGPDAWALIMALNNRARTIRKKIGKYDIGAFANMNEKFEKNVSGSGATLPW